MVFMSYPYAMIEAAGSSGRFAGVAEDFPVRQNNGINWASSLKLGI